VSALLDVITTHGVAIKAGQGRVHIPVRSLHPWHRTSEVVQCPGCETVYTMSGDFEKQSLLDILNLQHTKKQEHPDVIASGPSAYTRIQDCDCERVSGAKTS
jgi:glycine/serine hydroxymethyltransferase